MSRVFLPEPAKRFNLAQAKVFGELVYLAEQRLDPFNVELTLEILTERLSALAFNPEKDLLCMTGNTIILAYSLTAASRLFGSVKLLLFDARTSSYCERVLT